MAAGSFGKPSERRREGELFTPDSPLEPVVGSVCGVDSSGADWLAAGP